MTAPVQSTDAAVPEKKSLWTKWDEFKRAKKFAFLSSFPNTDAFQVRIDAAIAKSTADYNLSVEGAVPEELASSAPMKDLWRTVALADFWEKWLDELAGRLFTVLLFASCIVPPFLIARWGQMHQAWWMWPLQLGFLFISCLLMVIVLLLPIGFLYRIVNFYRASDGSVFMIVVTLLLLLETFGIRELRALHRPLDPSQVFDMSFYFGVFLIVLFFALVYAPRPALLRRLRRRVERTEPHPFIVFSLAAAWQSIGGEIVIGSWNSADTRRRLAAKLEHAAALIESALPATLATGDLATDSSLQSEFEAHAAGLRELQKDVLLSRIGGPQEIANTIKDLLIHAIRFEWDAFPVAEPEEVTRRQQLSSRLLPYIRALLISAIPVLLLFWMNRPSFPIPSGTAPYGWTRIGLFLWLILTLLSLVDPGYASTSQTLGVADKVLNFVKGGSGSGKTGASGEK